MSKYSEKLRDPRWQKKRLKVLERDDWTCQECGDKTTTLHVHHKKYTSGKDPWEYDDDVLITLCEKCHAIAHDPPKEVPSTSHIDEVLPGLIIQKQVYEALIALYKMLRAALRRGDEIPQKMLEDLLAGHEMLTTGVAPLEVMLGYCEYVAGFFGDTEGDDHE